MSVAVLGGQTAVLVLPLGANDGTTVGLDSVSIPAATHQKKASSSEPLWEYSHIPRVSWTVSERPKATQSCAYCSMLNLIIFPDCRHVNLSIMT